MDANSTYTDGPPAAIDFGEMDDTRTYNKRNELRTRAYTDYANPSTPATITLDYYNNGSLKDDGEKFEYEYNPFCQLVGIYATGTSKGTVKARFRYNGLGMRIMEQLDTSRAASPGPAGTPDGIVDGDDPEFFLMNDLQGRRLATYRDVDTDPKETFVYHADNAFGPAFKGGPLLRDRDADLFTNPHNWALNAADSTRAERLYHCGDFRGNIVALVWADGKLAEQARYSATGVPIGIPLGDVDGTFLVDGTDGTCIDNCIKFSTGYEVRFDPDLDGDVDSADYTIVTSLPQLNSALGRGWLSAAEVANRRAIKAGDWRQSMGFYDYYAPLLGSYFAVCISGSDIPVIPYKPLFLPMDREFTEEEFCHGACANKFNNIPAAVSLCFKSKPIICICRDGQDAPNLPSRSTKEADLECTIEYERRNWEFLKCGPQSSDKPDETFKPQEVCEMKAKNIDKLALCVGNRVRAACYYDFMSKPWNENPFIERRHRQLLMQCLKAACRQEQEQVCFASAWRKCCDKNEIIERNKCFVGASESCRDTAKNACLKWDQWIAYPDTPITPQDDLFPSIDPAQ